MAITDRRRMTLDEFLELPDQKPALEFEPDGTVVQKMSPKGQHSVMQSAVVELINSFARGRRLALAFPELRSVYAGAAYVPDVSVYRWERIPRGDDGKVANDFYEPPDVAVEVVSPKQSVNFLVRKSVWYVEHGVRITLVIDPEDESVLVFRNEVNTAARRGADPIDLSDVLPGFELTAGQIFAELRL